MIRLESEQNRMGRGDRPALCMTERKKGTSTKYSVRSAECAETGLQGLPAWLGELRRIRVVQGLACVPVSEQADLRALTLERLRSAGRMAGETPHADACGECPRKYGLGPLEFRH